MIDQPRVPLRLLVAGLLVGTACFGWLGGSGAVGVAAAGAGVRAPAVSGVSGVSRHPRVGTGVASPTPSERRLVAVLAFHLRHESSLALLASTRATDAKFGDLARQTAARAATGADELDAQLRRWSISPSAAAALRDRATGVAVMDTGAGLHLSCSLQGPTSDIDRLQAASSAEVAAVFAQSEFTAALEADQLVAIAASTGAVRGATDRLDRVSTAWQPAAIRALSPYLLATDRAYAANIAVGG